ncbi:uncharacterized protein PGRI_061440 [Penicillium griseofulvum]|uniref:Uncharacterized protein n=1 Tax=Penicillium patulum TaxID=5078 RepID=A0A135LMI7_PENPA|nr:uncharacterized protein PGRI_061440 [Penicillium griseofulvum]KXG50177.1 hypothetical protein PGRI_061440 [Penicillium griseofulvum]
MDNIPPPEQANPAGATGAPSRRPLGSFDELFVDLLEAYRRYREFAEAIYTGDDLSPLFPDDSLWLSDIYRVMMLIFGEPHPRVVGDQDPIQDTIQWTDVLSARLTPEDFQCQPNGMFQCRVRGVLIEIRATSYYDILSGVAERLLQPLQNLSGQDREVRIRMKLHVDLLRTFDTLVSFAHRVVESLMDLHRSQFVYTTTEEEVVEPRTSASANPIPNDPNSDSYNVNNDSDSQEAHNHAVKEETLEPGVEQADLNLFDIPQYDPVDSAHDTHGHMSATQFLGQDHLDSASDSDEFLPTLQSGSSYTHSNVTSDYAISASDVLERLSSDLSIDMDDGSSYFGDVSHDTTTISSGHTDNDDHAIHSPRENSIDPVRGPDTMTVIQNSIQAAVEQVNRMEANAALPDSDTIRPVNNDAVSNMDSADANAPEQPGTPPNAIRNMDSADMNAPEQPGTPSNAVRNMDSPNAITPEQPGTPSNAVSNLVGPWLENVSTPASAIGSNANPSEPEIPARTKTEEPTGPTVSAAENRDRIRPGGSKRPRVESPSPVPKPRTFIKYTQNEEENALDFANRMIGARCTIEEFEREYAEEFGVSRTASAVCKRFQVKKSWAFLKPIRDAKKQKTESS